MSMQRGRPLAMAWIIALAILAGVIVGASISAGQSDARVYQVTCPRYHICTRQYAYAHVDYGIAPVVGGVTVSVAVMCALFWIYGGRGTMLSGPCASLCDGDFRETIRNGMTALPYGLNNEQHRLLVLEPRKEFAAKLAKAAKAKSAALGLVAGEKYSPCDFLEARDMLMKEFPETFRHVLVASAHSGGVYIIAAADLGSGYALGLSEGHYYALKTFLDLLARGTDLDQVLAARHFAVVRIGVGLSFGDLVPALLKTASADALVTDQDHVIGMISFAKLLGLLLRRLVRPDC